MTKLQWRLRQFVFMSNPRHWRGPKPLWYRMGRERFERKKGF